jgi:hypothetical protein
VDERTETPLIDIRNGESFKRAVQGSVAGSATGGHAAEFPSSHPGHPDHPRHSLYVDLYREIGYANLHLHPALRSTTKREKLAAALATQWVTISATCDPRVEFKQVDEKVVAWDNNDESRRLQASENLSSRVETHYQRRQAT